MHACPNKSLKQKARLLTKRDSSAGIVEPTTRQMLCFAKVAERELKNNARKWIQKHLRKLRKTGMCGKVIAELKQTTSIGVSS